MTTWRVAAVLLLGVVSLGAGGTRDAPVGAPASALAGTTWHTVRIDGDALFFVIREVGVRFDDAQRFVAAVRFIDGQQTSRRGTYRVSGPGRVVVTIDGLGGPKELRYRRDGKDLIVRDPAYDATVRLAPGKMDEDRWF